MAEAALLVNGELVPLEGPHLNARDRGFMLGDGLFETVRVQSGQARRWARHLARLRSGAAAIGLPLPWTDAELTAMLDRTLAAGGLAEAVVRLTVSRGVAQGRGLLPEPDARPTLVIHAAPYAGYAPDLYQRGMRAIVSSVRRNEHSPAAAVKSLNYLDNILARQEAAAQGADEALLLNNAGMLAGASAANLFLVFGERIATPPTADGALPGTVRAVILEGFGGTVVEPHLELADLAKCSEAFLTNALMGVMPLTAVGGYVIGDGKPGAITRDLAGWLAQT